MLGWEALSPISYTKQRFGVVTDPLVGFGTVGVYFLIFGVPLHLLLKVLHDDGSMIFAELKHCRVKDFVVEYCSPDRSC
jgi:hypothetical protein